MSQAFQIWCLRFWIFEGQGIDQYRSFSPVTAYHSAEHQPKKKSLSPGWFLASHCHNYIDFPYQLEGNSGYTFCCLAPCCTAGRWYLMTTWSLAEKPRQRFLNSSSKWGGSVVRSSQPLVASCCHEKNITLLVVDISITSSSQPIAKANCFGHIFRDSRATFRLCLMNMWSLWSSTDMPRRPKNSSVWWLECDAFAQMLLENMWNNKIGENWWNIGENR